MFIRGGARQQTSDSRRRPGRLSTPHQNAGHTVCNGDQIGAGRSVAEVAAAFGVSVQTVRRWMARVKPGGAWRLSIAQARLCAARAACRIVSWRRILMRRSLRLCGPTALAP
ncbi:helix-turn-helix domain-containing protein [Aliiruegeria haliotis]|uniref:helix-turn-helix domain-containing protein n=1 Tax=Aliiruegeria haliotis TaxID=1280846 RepID=UPI0011B29B6E